MALGTLKCDTIENDNSQSVTVANLVTLDTNKANLSGATFTGDVTLNAQNELRLADSDSSNYVAFASPATVTTNSTWTLPSDAPSANDVLTVTSVSSNNPTLEWAPASGGKILQVVSDEHLGQFSQATSTNLTDISNLSVNITPSATTSRILLIAELNWSASLGSMEVAFAFRRTVGGTTTKIGASTYGDTDVAFLGQWGVSDTQNEAHVGWRMVNTALHDVDNPSTTSEITYTVGLAGNFSTGGNVRFGRTDNTSSAEGMTGTIKLIAMEIGA